MVQVLTTIFFSGAALAAMSVIAASIADDLDEVRTALGIVPALPTLPSARVRVRRIDPTRGLATPAPVRPLRAAA